MVTLAAIGGIFVWTVAGYSPSKQTMLLRLKWFRRRNKAGSLGSGRKYRQKVVDVVALSAYTTTDMPPLLQRRRVHHRWFDSLSQDFFNGHDMGAYATQHKFLTVTVPIPIGILNHMVGIFAM